MKKNNSMNQLVVAAVTTEGEINWKKMKEMPVMKAE